MFKSLISNVGRAVVALGWLGICVTAAPYVAQLAPTSKTAQASQDAQKAPGTALLPPKVAPPRRQPPIAEIPPEAQQGVGGANRPAEVIKPDQPVLPPLQVFGQPRKKRPAEALDATPPRTEWRYFQLPESPYALRPEEKLMDEPKTNDPFLAQVRYDNDQSRFNIRETLGRLEGMGIRVTLNWAEKYGSDAPWDVQQCLDENWELRWRQYQLNSLMGGTALPPYQSRPSGMSRITPVGWKQCGSGKCDPNNPYCPYIPGGRQ